MSFDARIAFAWGDGEHVFRLAIAQLAELQEKTGVGPQELLDRISRRAWRAEDLLETLRLGLIGGGLPALQARKLVERYGYPGQPLGEAVLPAQRILIAALIGDPADPVGKPPAEEAATETATTASPSPPSMAPAAPSASTSVL